MSFYISIVGSKEERINSLEQDNPQIDKIKRAILKRRDEHYCYVECSENEKIHLWLKLQGFDFKTCSVIGRGGCPAPGMKILW